MVREARARAHRAQELQVIAWPERRVAAQSQGVGGNRKVDTEQVVRLANASQAVVFDAVVDVLRSSGVYDKDLRAARVLPPGSDATLQLGTDLALGDSVFLRFRDLRGTWWRRNENGHLDQTFPNGLVKV